MKRANGCKIQTDDAGEGIFFVDDFSTGIVQGRFCNPVINQVFGG